MRPSLFRTPLIIAALLLGLPAQAQYSALLPSKGATTNAPAPTEVVRVSDPKQELADAKARVKDAQDVLQRLQAQLKQPGLSEDARKDLLKQFNLQQTLFDRYSQQVDYLKQLDVLAQKIADAKQARDNWTPPAGMPPWSVVEGDAVRNDMLLQESQLA